MVYITGDTHIPIDVHKLSTDKFRMQRKMTDGDYTIICGDFGGVWNAGSEEDYWLKWIGRKNFTTLFVDGNHENHKRLDEEFPVVERFNGSVHKISEKIYHLMRGQVYSIDGKSIFTMGGASSHDMAYRTEGINWWEKEMPSKEEYEIAERNLDAIGWRVDYIITHCAPSSIQRSLSDEYEENELTEFLEMVKNKTKFIKWYFGHYHVDRQVDEKYVCLFNDIQLVE